MKVSKTEIVTLKYAKYNDGKSGDDFIAEIKNRGMGLKICSDGHLVGEVEGTYIEDLKAQKLARERK